MPTALDRIKQTLRTWWERNICAECPKELDYPWYSTRTVASPFASNGTAEKTIALVLQGSKPRAIAKQLSVSQSYVEHQLSQVVGDLGLDDAVELLFFARTPEGEKKLESVLSKNRPPDSTC